MKRPLCLLCLAFAVTVAIVMRTASYAQADMTLPDTNGQQLTVYGQIEHTEISNDIYVIYLKNVTFCDEYKTIPQEQFQTTSPIGALCYMSALPDIAPQLGSYVKIAGRAELFRPATNPGEFDRQRYYHILGMDFTLKNAVLMEKSTIYKQKEEGLRQVRNKMASVLDDVMNEKEASVVKAMLLGDKQTLDTGIKGLYRQVGISHIIAISGLHISLLGMGIYKLFRRCSLNLVWAGGITIFIMYHYGVMTGMSASAYRAIFMFSLHLIANMVRRSYDMLTAMALAGVCILIEEPLYLYHTGFQLSFGAVLGIGLLNPVLTEFFPTKNRLLQALLSNVSISLITLPMLLSAFYEFPIYSFIMNLMVIPLLGVLLTDGIICIPIGCLSVSWGKIAAFPAQLILLLYEKAALLFSSLPFHTWITGKPERWRIFAYYMILALIFGYHEYHKKYLSKSDQKNSNRHKKPNIRQKQYAAIAVITIITSAVVTLTARSTSGLTVTMLDVGQGDCFFISSGGHTYLIDGGSSSKSKVGTYQVIPFLKANGVSRLEYIFISHEDNDHISAITELLELKLKGESTIAVRNLVLPDIICKGEAFVKLEDTARAAGSNLIYISKGDAIRDGKLSITCLHPDKGFVTSDPNEYSMVLSLSYGMVDILFTGDVEGKGETALYESLLEWKQNDMLSDYEVLKVAHHGSAYSTGAEILSLIAPGNALISCGQNNSYGHPHAELLERLQEQGAAYYSTDQAGAVTLWTDGQQLWIKEYIKSPFG